MNWNDCLGDDRAVVELGPNEMNRATRETNTRRQRLPLSVQAAEGGEKRWMNVDHPIVPRLNETAIEHPHKPGQTDKLDPPFAQQLAGLRRKGVSVAMRYDHGGNSSCFRQPETRRCRAAADNESDLRGIAQIAASVDQRLQV